MLKKERKSMAIKGNKSIGFKEQVMADIRSTTNEALSTINKFHKSIDKMDNLTLEQVTPYFPHGIQAVSLPETIHGQKYYNKIFTVNQLQYKDKTALVWTNDKKFVDQFSFIGRGFRSTEFKLLLHPLSAITEQIEVNGKKLIFANMYLSELELVIIKKIGPLGLDLKDHLQYNTINNMYKHHFDVDGLIGKNLAVAIQKA